MIPAPGSQTEVIDAVKHAIENGMQNGRLTEALDRYKATLSYSVLGVDAAFNMNRYGLTIDTDELAPPSRPGLISIFADRATSHLFLSRQISFSTALATGGLRITGTKERMSWILAYLEPVYDGYLEALGEKRE